MSRPNQGGQPEKYSTAATKLSAEGSNDPSRVYLYEDRTNPVPREANIAAYLDKLRFFVPLKVS